MKQGTFTGVGLGAGDAELITLKGYRALQEADIIFYPVSILKNGQEQSFSVKILDQLDINVPCKPLIFPMIGDVVDNYYQEAFNVIRSEYKKGSKVVLVSEGDLLFYSTFGYIFKLAQNAGIPCNLIPGIPAFIASATLGEQPLVEKDNSLEVIVKPNNFEVIRQALNRNSTLIIMKIKVLDGWCEFLKKCGHLFLYVERAGTTQEYYTSDANDLEHRLIPYFSLLIIYPNP